MRARNAVRPHDNEHVTVRLGYRDEHARALSRSDGILFADNRGLVGRHPIVALAHDPRIERRSRFTPGIVAAAYTNDVRAGFSRRPLERRFAAIIRLYRHIDA